MGAWIVITMSSIYLSSIWGLSVEETGTFRFYNDTLILLGSWHDEMLRISWVVIKGACFYFRFKNGFVVVWKWIKRFLMRFFDGWGCITGIYKSSQLYMCCLCANIYSINSLSLYQSKDVQVRHGPTQAKSRHNKQSSASHIHWLPFIDLRNWKKCVDPILGIGLQIPVQTKWEHKAISLSTNILWPKFFTILFSEAPIPKFCII